MTQEQKTERHIKLAKFRLHIYSVQLQNELRAHVQKRIKEISRRKGWYKQLSKTLRESAYLHAHSVYNCKGLERYHRIKYNL